MKLAAKSLKLLRILWIQPRRQSRPIQSFLDYFLELGVGSMLLIVFKVASDRLKAEFKIKLF